MKVREDFGQYALQRARMKNLPEPERHFEEYRQELLDKVESEPKNHIALSIMDSGIFWKGGLRGHAGHKKIYPIKDSRL